VLWTYGKAGCGKTVLSSVVIEDLQARFRSAYDAVAMIYLLIDVNDMAKRTSLGLAKSAVL
jgi:gluconate kinase